MTKPLLTSEWIKQLQEYNKLLVGFSGGLDSTVLLHALWANPLLQGKLIAVHVNHQLSANAQAWQDHCQALCHSFNVAFVAHSVEFNRQANIEEGARVARYEVFSSLLGEHDCLLLGHHLDDQAETVLLQLFRGSGVDGLAAMPAIGQCGTGSIARPLLTCSRAKLEHYALNHQLTWVEDESNQDTSYARNYLRQKVMPLLASQWPAVVGNIARAATHCQQAKNNLDDLALFDCKELASPTRSLFITPLRELSSDRMSNILRFWLKINKVQAPSTVNLQRLIREMIFAAQDAVPLVSWDNIKIRRYQDRLYLDSSEELELPDCTEWADFPNPLQLTSFCLSALKAEQGVMVPFGAKVTVRFRQGGELFFLHGQTKQLKKLFQEWQIPPWQRETTPLLYINDQLAAVVGYAISDLFFTRDAAQSWCLEIQE